MMFTFKLDFTVSVPFVYCPDARKAGALYIQCIAQAPMNIEFRQISTGIFLITVNNESDKKKLVNKSLSYDFGGNNGHTLKTAKVPLVLQEKRPYYQNPKWVTIDKLYDSGLSCATHKQVDEFLLGYGTLIVPTRDKTDAHGFRTGKREARIDMTNDIERWQSVTMKVTVEKKEVEITGKANFYYKGQPYHCRECQVTHNNKCPQKVAKEAAEGEVEKVRKTKTKTLLIGDSNLRRVNEKAFYAATDCATGAKLGQIANALDWTATDEYDNVIIHAGQNNVLTDPAVKMDTWETQMKGEVSKLKTKTARFKKTVLVGVSPAPWCRKTDKTRLMREKVNHELQKLTTGHPDITYIDIEQDDDDCANWEDDRHMTEKFTKYMMGKVSEEMYSIHGGQFFVRNTPWTCKGKYSGVKGTYSIGCNTCTGMGPECTCKSSNKQSRPSRGESPPNKQVNKKH